MARKSPKSVYEQIYEDQWLPVEKSFDLACCDCHLVHGIYMRLRDGRLQMKFKRNNRSTSALRRHHAIAAKGKRNGSS